LRVKFLVFAFVAIWISLIVRIFYLAIEHNNYYEVLANQNTDKTIPIAPIRGEILDTNGRPIAINKLGFRIEMRPHLQKKVLKKELHYVAKYIPSANFANMYKEYRKKDSYYNHDFIPVVDFISYKQILPIYTRLHLHKNIHIVSSPKRYYPYNDLAAHVIGYVSKANRRDIVNDPSLSIIGSVGKSGIEKYYNKFLEGRLGYKEIKVNAQNEEVQELYESPPQENHNITLNLDMRLEKYISKMYEKRNDTGAVVVMRTDGAILAAASFPEYDLNDFVTGISQKQWDKLLYDVDKPFTDKLINGLYPPGSVIKIGLGLIFITTTINEWWTINSTGNYWIGNRDFRDWKPGGHGITNITKAITESCDDFFYRASVKTGIAIMSEGLKRYGLGEKTGVDLPNEFIGTIPDPVWKENKFHQPWYIGDTINTSIGQGYVLVTPMQIARLTALIATGKLVTPHIAKIIGNKPVKPVYEEVLTPKEKRKLHIIQHGMYNVCNAPDGTAARFIFSKVRIAGKTGTAQVVGIPQDIKKRLREDQMKYYRRSHAWLTTYGPYRDPQFVVTVLIEHGGHGGYAAGEMVSKIFNWLLKEGYIKRR
jgi:penicillin-binding protein 2